MVAIWAIDFLPSIFCASWSRLLVMSLTALSIPIFNSIGLAPAATFFKPSLAIACARTVAVVVPSPAMSFVFEATCLHIWAPRFSNGSSKSIDLATVTPSFVTVGAPAPVSIITFLPAGPNVDLTASANWFTPLNNFSLAFVSNLICFAIFSIHKKYRVTRGYPMLICSNLNY